MRRFEIVIKDRKLAKLTVAIDRTTLKMPTSMALEERTRIETVARKIDAELPPVLFTVRGFFKTGRIRLLDKPASLVREWIY